MSDYRQWCERCGNLLEFGSSHKVECFYSRIFPSKYTLKDESSEPKKEKLSALKEKLSQMLTEHNADKPLVAVTSYLTHDEIQWASLEFKPSDYELEHPELWTPDETVILKFWLSLPDAEVFPEEGNSCVSLEEVTPILRKIKMVDDDGNIWLSEPNGPGFIIDILEFRLYYRLV